MKARAPLTSIDAVDALLAKHCSAAPIVSVPLAKSAGRVLREELTADRPLPPFDRVMMDGFAVRWDAEVDSESVFRVVGRAAAGEVAPALPAESLAAIEVMTGAVLPTGADTVVPYEETRYDREAKAFCLGDPSDFECGQFVHREGSDYPRGAVLVGAGVPFGPVEAGIAASCGYAAVRVSQHPRLALVSTGDELIPIEDAPAPHQIRRSNAAALENALARAGFPVGQVVHLDDDARAGGRALEALIAENDLIVVTGAVSRGLRDWVAPALDDLGKCLFHGVAQRPGKPMGVWQTASGTTVFGLPGNPVSALVGLARHVLPYLWRAAGVARSARRVRLAADLSFKPPLTCFMPVKVDAEGVASACPVNNSGDFAGLHGSTGFVELSADQTLWKTGEWVSFHPWFP